MYGWVVFNAAVTVALVYFGIYTTVLHHKIDRLERTPGPPGPPGPQGPMGFTGPKGEPGEPAGFYHYIPPDPSWIYTTDK